MKRYVLGMLMFCVVILFGKSVGLASQAEESEMADIVIEPVDGKEWVVGDAVVPEDFVIYAVDQKGQVLAEPLEPKQLKLEPENLEGAGETVISVEYGEFFAHTTISVKEEQIEGISSYLKEERNYGVGKVIGMEDICVYAYYNSGCQKEITSKVQLKDTRIFEGENAITISYEEGGKEYTSILKVMGEEKRLLGISVVYLGEKQIAEGGKIEEEQIVVNAFYNDDSMEQKDTGFRVLPYQIAEGKVTNIMVEYEGKKAEFQVEGKSTKKQEEVQTVTASAVTGASVTSNGAVTAGTEIKKIPAKTTKPKATATPIPVTYQCKSAIKGVGLLSGNKKKNKIYTKKKGKFTLKTTGIKKIEYQLVLRGKKKTKYWKKVRKNSVLANKQGDWRLYLRFTTLNGKKIEKKTNSFVIDWTAPDVSGAKNGKTYSHTVKLKCKDLVSGIKKVTLNGKKCRKTVSVTRSGSYKLCVEDQAKNKKQVCFSIVRPTATPKPTITPVTPAPFVPVQSVKCSKSSMQIKTGECKTLSATVFPANATNKSVSWKTSNPSVVSVSASGTVKGKQQGTAYVIVRSNSNSAAYATCVVYVQ